MENLAEDNPYVKIMREKVRKKNIAFNRYLKVHEHLAVPNVNLPVQF